MIHPLRSKPRRISLVAFICVLLLGGGCAFWFGLHAFRARAQEQKQDAQDADTVHDVAASDLAALPATATLTAFSGGEHIGRMTRVFTEHVATIELLVTLPAIETSAFTYDVWLVKDGLADVVDLGALASRADGTWVGTFVAGPATGVVDPTLFSEVVIMLEPRDGNVAPSGMKAAVGRW